jgi:hypothetical protein
MKSIILALSVIVSMASAKEAPEIEGLYDVHSKKIWFINHGKQDVLLQFPGPELNLKNVTKDGKADFAAMISTSPWMYLVRNRNRPTKFDGVSVHGIDEILAKNPKLELSFMARIIDKTDVTNELISVNIKMKSASFENLPDGGWSIIKVR